MRLSKTARGPITDRRRFPEIARGMVESDVLPNALCGKNALARLRCSGTAAATLYQQIGPDPCAGTLSVDQCFNSPMVASSSVCPDSKGTTRGSCQAYCNCIYNENVKKCGTNLQCQEFASAERNACLASCITDYA